MSAVAAGRKIVLTALGNTSAEQQDSASNTRCIATTTTSLSGINDSSAKLSIPKAEFIEAIISVLAS